MRAIQSYRPAAPRRTNGIVRLTQPLSNIIEHAEGYTIELATPGYSREDMSINVKNGVLIVEGTQEISDEANYSRREFGLGNFTKRFRLGDDLDRDSISAKYSDGVLSIEVHRRPEEKRRDIEIL